MYNNLPALTGGGGVEGLLFYWGFLNSTMKIWIPR